MSADAETKKLPSWLLWLGSGLILFHFFALLIAVLAVESGPWMTRFGPDMYQPPRFARQIDSLTRYYLQPLQIASSYHFLSNQTDLDTVYFEAQVRDAKGEVIQTIRIPDEGANFWIANRQNLVAQQLSNDMPVQPPRGETIPAPGKKMPTVKIWDSPGGEPPLKLQEVPEHLIRDRLRDRPEVYAPTEYSLFIARSYARYLCRHYDGASAEIIRHSRRPIVPALLLMREPPPGTFEDLICSFGEYRLEK
jgi:hypothetical protein